MNNQLSAVSYLLFYFSFPLSLFPFAYPNTFFARFSFLRLHFSFFCIPFSLLLTLILFASTIPQQVQQQKAIKAYVCLATNAWALPRKIEKAPTKLSTIASSASAIFPASLLRASSSLFSHFFKAPLCFCGEDPEAARRPPNIPLNGGCKNCDSHTKGSTYWYYCNTLLRK